jgi:hypothetical protein
MGEVPGGDLVHVGQEALDHGAVEDGAGRRGVVAEVPEFVEDAEADVVDVAGGEDGPVDERVALGGARPPVEGEEVDAGCRGPRDVLLDHRG